jgi:flagellar protein FliL
MAAKAKQTPASTKEDSIAAPPKRLKKLIILILGAAALIGVGVGGAVALGYVDHTAQKEEPRRPKLVERDADATESEGNGGEGEQKAEPRIGTVSVSSDRQKIDPKRFAVAYIPIEQQFTSNLANGSSFIQIGLSLSTYYDDLMLTNIKRQMIPIRSSVLTILSTQNATVISTPEGRQLLQAQLTRAINQVLREKEGFGGIDNVYLTNMVVQ